MAWIAPVEAAWHDQSHGRVMTTPDASDDGTGSPQASDSAQRSFGPTVAIALIIGVGVFNLPTSLATFGPISLVSMGLTTLGALALALLFAALSRRLPADGGPHAYAHGVRQHPRIPQCVVVLDHRLGGQRGDRGRLGAVRRGVPEQRAQPVRLGPAGSGRAVAARVGEPRRGAGRWAWSRWSPRC